LLLDPEDYSAGILLDDLQQRGFSNIHRVAVSDQLGEMVRQHEPVVVIFNFHFQQQDRLEDCSTIKALAPDTAVLAIVSAGPAIKMVRQWAKESQAVDVVIEKPLSDERFFVVLRDLVQTRQSSRQLEASTKRMANLLPAGAIAAMNRKRGEEAEMFQAAVLFTDIRRSTQAITQFSPQDFFSLLNRSLSAQSAHISTFEGTVIKYTGDGVFAIFRGMGRSYLALRCAIALAQSDSQKILPFGIGVAEGLVLAGLVGDSNRAGLRRQYDVIGATVHLSARLCSLARPGEVITTEQVHRNAKISVFPARHIGAVAIRGFDSGVECVAYEAPPAFTEPPDSL
jgi:adenylate cyclase